MEDNKQEDSREKEVLDISIVIPIYNEEENIRPLFEEIESVLDDFGRSYEVIFVDDGSSDQSPEILRELAQKHEPVRTILFRRNFGQTAAQFAGFQNSRGELIIPLDGDGQNDPGDIPKMVGHLEEENFDVVSGWRKNRKDRFLRSFLSRLANGFISRVSGIHLHDYGCTLKVYRAELLKDVQLYGEMHRLIPIFVAWVGGRVTEIEVNHRPRTHGTSKYGFNRTFKVLIDLITAKFLSSYLEKPAYVFGFFGFLTLIFSFLTMGFVIFRKFYLAGEWVSPLLFIGLGAFGMSVILFLLGILAELMVRIYFESQGKKPFSIQEIVESE